jgi:hypothetical protein
MKKEKILEALYDLLDEHEDNDPEVKHGIELAIAKIKVIDMPEQPVVTDQDFKL